MDSLFWSRLHGGVTHFPIAMIFGAVCFEMAGLLPLSRRQDFQNAAYWMLLAAGASVFVAAVSGLILDNGTVLGRGLLGRHHLFVWPSFALIIALASGRWALGQMPAGKIFAAYFTLLLVACILTGLAGYTGGEILLQRAAR